MISNSPHELAGFVDCGCRTLRDSPGGSCLEVEVRWRTNGVRAQVVRSSRIRLVSHVETFPSTAWPTDSAEEPEERSLS